MVSAHRKPHTSVLRKVRILPFSLKLRLLKFIPAYISLVLWSALPDLCWILLVFRDLFPKDYFPCNIEVYPSTYFTLFSTNELFALLRNDIFIYLTLHFTVYYVLDICCNKTNLIHYLSSVYSVIIPLHFLDLLVAHHQEVTMNICNN